MQLRWWFNTHNLKTWRPLPKHFWSPAWKNFLTGESTLNKYQDKKRYMAEVAKGKSHRQISKTGSWLISAATIRNELIEEGVIVQSHVRMDKKTGKNHVYFKLSGIDPKKEVTPEFWSCGTPKSTNNAFYWNNGKGSLFTKQDLANAKNQGRPANYNPFPISPFSRA